MAQDQFNATQAGTLSPEDYAAQQQINRQQRFAEMLMAQNQQPQGQMVSGRYVAPSFFQMLNPVANVLAGAYIGKEGDEQAAKLAEKIRTGKAIAEQSIINKMVGTPAQTTELAGPYAGNVPMPTAAQPAVAPDLAGALREIGTNQYGAGKDLKPTILKQMMPEDTSDYKNFLKVKAEYDAKGIPITFNQYQDMDANRKRPVTNLNVNTGQHGFDNALKLRSDFRSEPIYKGFEEIKAAKNQIDQAVQKASPAGDLAAATKIMKILDPTSVVRESELAMAIAATGVEDRVMNYANMVITGQKLTPSQRKDFVDLSDKLYDAAGNQFNQKRNEYAGIAKRNQLDVEAAVGAPAVVSQGGWRIK